MNPHMTQLHKDILLKVVFHHMDQELRAKVYREVPAAYDDYYGEDRIPKPVFVVINKNELDRLKGKAGEQD